MGTFGGAFLINSPDFVYGQDPFTIISNSRFYYNFAYFSGNAGYVRSTIKGANHYMVAGGILVEYSTFQYNIGMKKTNGGALTITQDSLWNYHHQDYYANSGLFDYYLALDYVEPVVERIPDVVEPGHRSYPVRKY
jgi:hypothetical protein